MSDEENDEDEELVENVDFNTLLTLKPQKILLTYLFQIVDDRENFHNWNGDFSSNKNLEQWYKVLDICGYEISSEETQLLNGSHHVFGSDISDSSVN